MHCLSAFIIGFFIWAVFFAYTIYIGGGLAVALLTGPFVVSGVATIILAGDFAVRLLSSVITNKFSKRARVRAFARDTYELESAARKGNKAG